MESIESIGINQKTLSLSLVAVRDAILDGEPVIRAGKNVREKGNGLRSCAVGPGCGLHNGVIEGDVCGRILPDALLPEASSESRFVCRKTMACLRISGFLQPAEDGTILNGRPCC